jgi:hypothetical protein
MIVLKHCGHTYRADEKHLGYSIRCAVCGTVIPITRDTPDSALSSREPPKIEYTPPQPKSPWVPAPPVGTRHFLTRNWLFPAFGILALVVGFALAIFNYRSRTNANLLAQTSSSQRPLPATNLNVSIVTHPTPIPTVKSSSPTPKSIATPVGEDASTSPFEFSYVPTP